MTSTPIQDARRVNNYNQIADAAAFLRAADLELDGLSSDQRSDTRLVAIRALITDARLSLSKVVISA